MASERAKLAAKKVMEKAGAGKPVVLGHILREVGYAKDTADNPKQVTSTDTYQSEIMPFVEKMERERARILIAMSVKNLDEVQYQHLVGANDSLTKNIQLLSGKETERAGVTINVVNYEDGHCSA